MVDEIEKESKEEEKQVVDQFDHYRSLLRVYSNKLLKVVNEDFVLADLSINVRGNPNAVFIMDELKLINFLDGVYERLLLKEEFTDTYGKEIDNRRRELMKIIIKKKEEIMRILVHEVLSMLPLTRSIDGKVLKTGLKYGLQEEQPRELEEKRSIWSKMFGSKPREEER